MGPDSKEFEKKLLATFRLEAEGHLSALVSGLMELEKPLDDERHAAVVESVFRETHTLKGAARSVNLADIEEVCQALESVFSAAKRKEISLTREGFDLLHNCVSILEVLLKGTGPEVKAALRKRSSLIEDLIGLAQPAARPPVPPSDSATAPATKPAVEPAAVPPPAPVATPVAAPARIPGGDTGAAPAAEPRPVPEPPRAVPAGTESRSDIIRISSARLDTLMLKAEELGDAKRSAAQRSADLGRICRQFGPWKQRWAAIRTRMPALKRKALSGGMQKQQEHGRPELAKVYDFLDYTAEFVQNLESELVREKAMIRADHQFLLERTDSLTDDMKGLLMMPAGSMLEFLPRFVREFSRTKNKEVDLVIGGQEIMIDRRILDEMKDAFIHMVRNAIDHGIEQPETRAKKGKARSGKISIRFTYHEGNNVEILMEDDGAGIDAASVGAAAVKAGVLTPEDRDQMTEREIIAFIFHSGVTTSRIITDTSGRGLGLAIALEKVDRLGGSIETETTPGSGTRFRILLPLTLATFRGLVVSENRQSFVMPLKSVDRVLRVRPDTIKTVEGQAMIELENEPLVLVRLADALGIPRSVHENELQAIYIVVVVYADKRLGISVDEIGHAQEVMVKGLGRQLVRVKNIASATVLGTGKVVPVVNVGDLMKSAIRLRSAGGPVLPVSEEEKAIKKKSILVTEDSITSRMLLRNILEGAGYAVETAVDGMDALLKLRSGSFDIVVSDVDMPRMNGFVLTEKIRSDKVHAELPVVLVTALDSQADRERGIDVGANAYIVKSSFDQSNLLEVVRRLVGA